MKLMAHSRPDRPVTLSYICSLPLRTDTTSMYEKTYQKSKENPGGSPKDPRISWKKGDPPVSAPKKEEPKKEEPKEEAKAE